LDITKKMNEVIPDVLLVRGDYSSSIIVPIVPAIDVNR